MANVKLMNKGVAKLLPPLYSTENVPADEKVLRVKFFSIASNWTWYPVEYDPAEGRFFGLVVGHEREWGYFTLAELESLKWRGIPGVERDLYWTAKPAKEV